ncbi:TQO small subunit DoxD [Allorhizocola rhizosphaerae]|uniref:TQO small subunit DoxD n=1 Tax=Allorhizocola rhizosphaerae TaxID=1872709 RepID=UPI001B8CF731|nr:TQO small subunit DoxD [Allorhizocola rhizosphaerae]
MNTSSTKLDRALLAVVRVGLGFLWLGGAGWKVPPEFADLRHWTGFAVQFPVLPPYTWLVEHVVLPNFAFFGWAVLFLEASLGGFLLVGLGTRFWAVLGMAQTLAIIFSALRAPHEWPWSYFLMFMAHLAVFATAAGRYAGVDGVLRPAWQRSRSWPARTLVRVS